MLMLLLLQSGSEYIGLSIHIPMYHCCHFIMWLQISSLTPVTVLYPALKWHPGGRLCCRLVSQHLQCVKGYRVDIRLLFLLCCHLLGKAINPLDKSYSSVWNRVYQL